MNSVKEKLFKILKKVKNGIWKNKKILIIVIIVIALLAILPNIISFEKYENTIGNIRNYGYATKSGKWIYYLSPNEDMTKQGIFKIKEGDKQQTTKQQLIMDLENIVSLNVYKDYLYFISISNKQFNEEDDIDNKICRIKTDGSNYEVINDNELNNEFADMYVIDGKVYYIGADYNIYKMNLDGSKRELVLDTKNGCLGITDKYIIYNIENEEKSDYVTYIADINGKNPRPILEGKRLYSVNVEGDYIYYTNDSKQICKVKINGKNESVLYETTAYNLNVYGNYMYYINYKDEENFDQTVCIYRVKTNGTTKNPEIIKEFETYSSFIDVVGDWIIYLDSTDEEGFINLLKTDGTEEIKVYSLKYQNLYNQTEIETEIETENEIETEDVSQ